MSTVANEGNGRLRGSRRLSYTCQSQPTRGDRYLFYCHGLPAPELQYCVYDGAGRLVGRTDFAWPEHRLLGEFDGRIKYERLLREGERPSDAVVREKMREEWLCDATGWGMVRLVWADLYDGRAIAARIARRMRAAA
jgi:hypothetical protein